MNIWWRLIGAPISPLQQLAGVFYYGDPNLGRTFESIVWPISAGTPPPAGGTTADPYYFQLGNTVLNNFNRLLAGNYIFGRINPSLVNGKNIGYVRVANEIWGVSEMFYGDFCPPGKEIYNLLPNPRINIEAACQVMSSGFNYVFNTLGCKDKTVFDMRSDIGGTSTANIVVASFFGGDRAGQESIQVKADSGFSAPLQGPTSLATLTAYDDSFNKVFTNPTQNILATQSAAFYPNAVFNGSGSQLYYITDIGSGSAGDMKNRCYLGTTLNKNIGGLGSGVQVKMLGDTCSISPGGTGNTPNPTASPNSYIVTAANGTPIAPYTLQIENPTPFLLKFRSEPVSMAGRVLALKPDNPAAIPLVGPATPYTTDPLQAQWPGLGDGPWPNRWEDNAYPDIGVIYTPASSAGTVSIPLASNTVTGVGTSFQPEHLGMSINIGINKFLITAVNSSTSLTVSPAAPNAYAAVPYTIEFYYPVPRLPGDIRPTKPDNIVWFPVDKYTTPTPGPLTHPQLNERQYWRDRWLEQTIWNAIM
jgi:hypothetical protein